MTVVLYNKFLTIKKGFLQALNSAPCREYCGDG